MSKGPANSKYTSSFGSERICNFSVLFVPKNTFKLLLALMHWIQFFHDNKSLCINVATKCFLPEISFQNVIGEFHGVAKEMATSELLVLSVCYR